MQRLTASLILSEHLFRHENLRVGRLWAHPLKGSISTALSPSQWPPVRSHAQGGTPSPSAPTCHGSTGRRGTSPPSPSGDDIPPTLQAAAPRPAMRIHFCRGRTPHARPRWRPSVSSGEHQVPRRTSLPPESGKRLLPRAPGLTLRSSRRSGQSSGRGFHSVSYALCQLVVRSRTFL